MKFRYVLLGSAAALTLALPLTARAETPGFYIGGAAGSDFAIDGKASSGPGSDTVRYSTGPTGLLNLGYDFGNIRAEVEGSYAHNDVSSTVGAPLWGAGGNIRTWGVLFNGFYDIKTGTPWTPYIGGGIGVGFVHASLSGTRPPGTAVGLYNGSDTAFAYQAIGGVSYALTPQLSLTADYRYFATTDATFTSNGTKWNVENANHIITAGVRWSFGAPAAEAEVVQAAYVAPTPAPAPAPATEFSLLFDWDKSTITAESHATIVQAAAVAAQNKATIVLVTGYTDTTGSNQYNQALSERRAAAVKRDLIRQGISPDSIQTVGKGKTDLAVPTQDEVREHQNRRAQIILRIG